MKRFHMHLAVSDLASNIRFYSQLFGAAPTVEKEDYAKWMLDDPRINFAISARGATPGVDHIGIQVESEAELAELKQRYDAADAAAVTTETGTACCYMESNKHWLTDPQGIAWEAYHSLAEIPTFGKGEAQGAAQAEPNACCAPRSSAAKVKIPLGIPVVSAPVAAKSCC